MTKHNNSTSPKRRACLLLKQNLPGLMGRRDAAWDQAVTLIRCTEKDSASDREQQRICDHVVALLTIACGNTESILQVLSSPDTENREQKLHSLQNIIRSMAETWSKLVALERELFGAETILANFDAAESSGNTGILQNSAAMLLAKMRRILECSAPRLERYRSYTANSFSPVYAERYQHAYKSYLALYCSKYPLD